MRYLVVLFLAVPVVAWAQTQAAPTPASAPATAPTVAPDTAPAAAIDTLPPLTLGNGWLMPHDASENGRRIDWLLNVTMVFVVILFVIMVLWMLAAALKHGRHHKAEYDHGDAVKQVTFALGLSAL